MLFLRWSQAPRLIVCQIKIHQGGKSQERDRRDHPKDRPDAPAIARVERPVRMAMLRDVMAHLPSDLMRWGLLDCSAHLLEVGRGACTGYTFVES
jgi:hypothetical protein